MRSPMDGHSGYFPFLSTMNKTSINILAQIFLWSYVFILHGYLPKRIGGSLGKFMFSLNTLSIRVPAVQLTSQHLELSVLSLLPGFLLPHPVLSMLHHRTTIGKEGFEKRQ